MAESRFVALRRQLNRLFDDGLPDHRISHRVDVVLVVLIVVNISSLVLESVGSLRDRYGPIFRLIEQVATLIFAAEYLLRLWTAVDLSQGRFRHPLWGRLAYARGFFPIVDLISVLPAMLGLFGAADFRVLRLLRLLRMLKLTRHSRMFSLLWSVLCEEARSIVALLFIIALTTTTSGALMFMIEGEVQPDVFNSIPAGMWWAVEALTTVGYGDLVPITPLGKLVGGAVSVIGVGILALFSTLITVSFMDHLRLRREEYQRAEELISTTCPHCGENLPVTELMQKRLMIGARTNH